MGVPEPGPGAALGLVGAEPARGLGDLDTPGGTPAGIEPAFFQQEQGADQVAGKPLAAGQPFERGSKGKRGYRCRGSIKTRLPSFLRALRSVQPGPCDGS